MKVLLVQPPVRDFYQTPIRTQPLGLCYLAAALEQHGHTVSLLDCQAPGRKKRLPFPDAFSNLRADYAAGDRSPFRLYSDFYHFGLSESEIQAGISSVTPDAVGITCPFTPYYREALRVASQVKAFNPQIPVVAGGAHAGSLPEHLLGSPHVDYVVIGEGEETLPCLLKALATGASPETVSGIGFKTGGRIRISPRRDFISNLDSLPLPARHLLEPGGYRIGGQPYTMLLTSRGCSRNCTYCSVASVMGPRVRSRSITSIIEEIRYCRDRLGISLFDIEDDHFIHDRKHTLRLLESIIGEFGENAIQLLAMNGLSLLALDRHLLQKMKAAGFQRLDLALGTVSAAGSRRIGRDADPPRAETVLKEARGMGFPVTTYIILGLPGHRLEDMLNSILFLMERETLIGPSIFYPSPGSRLFSCLYPDGLPPNTDFSQLRSSAFPVEAEQFSRPDIITLLRIVRWINFVKRRLSLKNRRQISVSDLTRQALSRWWPDDLPRDRASLPRGCFYLSFTAPLKAPVAGRHLTAVFLGWRRFYGLRRIRHHNKALYTYQFFPYKSSVAVIDLFSRQAGRRYIKAAGSAVVE